MHLLTIIRIYLGLTQAELAEQSGVSFPDLNEMENKAPYGMIEKYRKVSQFLHIPVHAIVTNDILSVPAAFFEEMPRAEYRSPTRSKNGDLGRQGEDTVFRQEQQRLLAVNPTLSKLVLPCYKLHASRGYDIVSYKEDGKPVFIEVKTSEKANKEEFQLTGFEYSTAKKLTEAGYEYWVYYFSNWGNENVHLEKVPFQKLIGEDRIEPVRYLCDIRPRKEFENGILYFRKRKGISQIDAAHCMGIPVSCLCGYEAGDRRCPVTGYEKIARFYGVKIDDLLKDYPVKISS